MTDLERIVRRRTKRTFDHHGRKIIVQLEPGDILAMREERRKQWIRVAIHTLYTQLVWRDAQERIKSFNRRKAELVRNGMTKRLAGREARKEVRL